MEYIYICPKCGFIYGYESHAASVCSECKIETEYTGYNKDEWRDLSMSEKRKIKDGTLMARIQKQHTQESAESTGELRTVSEMIEMANQYQSTGAGIIETNNTKLPFQLILDSLEPDEDVILAVGANAGKIGKNAYQMMAVAFTDERMLVAGKPNSIIGSFMSSGVKSVKMDKVNSIGVFGMTVRIDTIGDEDVVLGSYSPEIRSKLSAEIQRIVKQYHGNAQSGQNITNVIQKSPAEQIKEFKELLDSGIITQEEFDAKKEQLLGL